MFSLDFDGRQEMYFCKFANENTKCKLHGVVSIKQIFNVISFERVYYSMF